MLRSVCYYYAHYEKSDTAQKATIHRVITMLATSKNALFPGHNHLLTTGTDYPSLAGTRAIISVSGHQYWWLAGGYDLEIGHFQKWLGWWLPGGQ